MLNMKESMSIYVRLFAALDLRERKITVVMETLDPVTGFSIHLLFIVYILKPLDEIVLADYSMNEIIRMN